MKRRRGEEPDEAAPPDANEAVAPEEDGEEDVGAPTPGYVDEDDAPPETPGRAIAIALGVAVASSATVSAALHFALEESRNYLGAIGALYALVATLAIVRMRSNGTLRVLRPRGGDFSVGAAVALVLYLAARGSRQLFAARGTPQETWIIQVYAMLGDPQANDRYLFGAVVFLIAALEELAWRGLVQPALVGAFGKLRGAGFTAALYALAHVPAAFVLANPVAGPNPLLPLAALGCGVAWGYIAIRFRRLGPALFAHGLFTWSMVAFPLWSPWTR